MVRYKRVECRNCGWKDKLTPREVLVAKYGNLSCRQCGSSDLFFPEEKFNMNDFYAAIMVVFGITTIIQSIYVLALLLTGVIFFLNPAISALSISG